MNKYAAHEDLLAKFDKAVTKKFPMVIVLPYTCSLFRHYNNPERVVYVGRKGVPDRLVLLSTGGFLWFDAKTGKAALTKEQRAFKKCLQYCTNTERVFKLTNIEDALSIIERYENQNPIPIRPSLRAD